MRNLLILTSVLILLMLGAAASSVGVEAVGAPTENYTLPNMPTTEAIGDEIKPAVNCILVGQSSQPESPPPSVTASFSGTSAADNHVVTANENWYLSIDINAPGWLYIYEYYPQGSEITGRWIAYKWQLLQSGVWKIGPFTPEANEPEGQHIYRIWFYGDDLWAAETPGNLVYWTYVRGATGGSSSLPPVPTATNEATFLDRLYKFITNPVVLVIGPSVIAIIVMFILYRLGVYGRKESEPPQMLLLPQTSGEGQGSNRTTIATGVWLVLPNGMEVQVPEEHRVMGRGDLARALGLDELGLISREHFTIMYSDDRFFIEDMKSANGTRLNGIDIRGKGATILNDGDIIELSGVARVKFRVV